MSCDPPRTGDLKSTLNDDGTCELMKAKGPYQINSSIIIPSTLKLLSNNLHFLADRNVRC